MKCYPFRKIIKEGLIWGVLSISLPQEFLRDFSHSWGFGVSVQLQPDR